MMMIDLKALSEVRNLLIVNVEIMAKVARVFARAIMLDPCAAEALIKAEGLDKEAVNKAIEEC